MLSPCSCQTNGMMKAKIIYTVAPCVIGSLLLYTNRPGIGNMAFTLTCLVFFSFPLLGVLPGLWKKQSSRDPEG